MRLEITTDDLFCSYLQMKVAPLSKFLLGVILAFELNFSFATANFLMLNNGNCGIISPHNCNCECNCIPHQANNWKWWVQPGTTASATGNYGFQPGTTAITTANDGIYLSSTASTAATVAHKTSTTVCTNEDFRPGTTANDGFGQPQLHTLSSQLHTTAIACMSNNWPQLWP